MVLQRAAALGRPMVYEPSFDEQARQDFVLGVKLLANGPVQQRVRDAFEAQVRPALPADAPPRAMRSALCASPEFRHWAALTHASQSLMWQAVEPTAQRGAPLAEARFAALQQRPRRGSLQLDPTLHVPPPIGNTEIHRQPGGFIGRPGESEWLPGLRYLGSSRIYGPGKGNLHAGGDARGAFLVEQIRREFPELEPRRILDLGCGLGIASQAVALAFPAADYHAIDVAGPLLKLGHLLAEERGVAIHFRQCDAAHMPYADGAFDLVVSHILFHETNAARLPQILRECHRLLAPGGAMLHVDVATQVWRLGSADQVMNDWQVQWNGEPFWAAFARIDMRAAIVAAGFDPATTFAEHRARPGSGVSYVFGARR
ncbi:MAG: class I SAM-dependent methyltransferase [Steroidobacteraceae bacterium]|nr:class I SAM-dependent methyltransferase [Steroidobacteraceae bacterium]MDW8260236.1 class I SAM-dependent methyltransferase [Gammaproteobacteria bacterium]